MPQLRNADQALKQLSFITRPNYVCRACRARKFHTTPPIHAIPFYRRIQETLFPSKQSRDAAKQREEQQQKQIAERARQDATKNALETKVVRWRGREEEFEVAAVVDPSVNQEYVAATHWDGLSRVGGDKWVRERRDRGEKYVGFMPGKRIPLTDEQWEVLIHHVTVEVLALRNAGRNVNDVCLPRSEVQTDWQRTQTTTIALDEAGKSASLRYGSPGAGDLVPSAIPHVPAVTEVTSTEVASAEEPDGIEQIGVESEEPGVSNRTPGPTAGTPLRELLAATAQTKLPQYPTATSWLNLRLENPLIKLAITKRILQLTGHRISDPILSNSRTLSDLYAALKTKPPPKKLAHSEKMLELGKNLANVEVHSKRQTMIHKEKRVGRWKIIEDELIARDLPVTGSRWINAKPRLGVERS